MGGTGFLHLGNVDRGAELFVVEAGLWIEGCLAVSLVSPTRCQKHPQPPSGDKGKVRLSGLSCHVRPCFVKDCLRQHFLHLRPREGKVLFLWDAERVHTWARTSVGLWHPPAWELLALWLRLVTVQPVYSWGCALLFTANGFQRLRPESRLLITGNELFLFARQTFCHRPT